MNGRIELKHYENRLFEGGVLVKKTKKINELFDWDQENFLFLCVWY
jgi:hypothetical protein